MKKVIPLILVTMAIVAVSGCVGESDVVAPTGYGVEITGFSADRSEVFTGQRVRIFMEAENLGQSLVERGVMTLIGNVRGTNGNYWTTSDPLEATIGELKPADPIREVPAEKKRVDWTLSTPTLSPGQTRTDTFEGRVYYDFNTTAQGTLWLYSPTEAEAVRNAGGVLDKSSITSSTGPIAIEVDVAPDPPELEGSDTDFSLYITLRNVGGGTVFYQSGYNFDTVPTLTSADLNKIDVSIEAGDLSITNCEAATTELAELIGTSTTLYCDADYGVCKAVEGAASATDESCGAYVSKTGCGTQSECEWVAKNILTKTSIPISIIADYGYYKDQSLSLTAVGK
jgi:hypothetical protein